MIRSILHTLSFWMDAKSKSWNPTGLGGDPPCQGCWEWIASALASNCCNILNLPVTLIPSFNKWKCVNVAQIWGISHVQSQPCFSMSHRKTSSTLRPLQREVLPPTHPTSRVRYVHWLATPWDLLPVTSSNKKMLFCGGKPRGFVRHIDLWGMLLWCKLTQI